MPSLRIAAIALIATAIAAAAAATALADGGAIRLTPTPALIKQLRAAHPAGTGPLVGRRCFPDPSQAKPICATYRILFARYRDKEYAAATFWRKETGFTDSTIQFVRTTGGRWSAGSDGWPPECGFPDAVDLVWGWATCDNAG